MKRNRLFWKFFFFLWLAQFVTALCVGFAMSAFDHRPHHPPPPSHTQGPMPPPHGPPPRNFLPPPLPILAGSVVSLLFAALLAAYFSRPIGTLRRAFEATASGRLDTRIDTGMRHRQDELADLGQDFDRMATRLQTLVESQQRLLHDVSHELRSPLGRLQAAVGLMQQQPERACEFIERIQRETGRMDCLVGELLTLSRLEANAQRLNGEQFDLSELLIDLADDARFGLPEAQCKIALAPIPALSVYGNPELLRRAIDNVLRNALRHAPSGSTVSLSCVAASTHIEVNIADTGDGVPNADLQAIFEPFYRSAGAMAHAGYGLGLTLARRIMALHGGSIQAENLNPGFVVHLRIPHPPGA